MTEVTRTTEHVITLDAPGQYNLRRIEDGEIVNDQPFASATEAAIEATFMEWRYSQRVTRLQERQHVDADPVTGDAANGMKWKDIEPRQSRTTEKEANHDH